MVKFIVNGKYVVTDKTPTSQYIGKIVTITSIRSDGTMYGTLLSSFPQYLGTEHGLQGYLRPLTPLEKAML